MPAVVGKTMKIWWFPTMRDAFWYAVAIAEVYVTLIDGWVFWYEALGMVLTYAAYIVSMAFNDSVMAKLGVVPPEDAEADAPATGGMATKEDTAPAAEGDDGFGLVTDAAHAVPVVVGGGNGATAVDSGSGSLRPGGKSSTPAARALHEVVVGSGNLQNAIGSGNLKSLSGGNLNGIVTQSEDKATSTESEELEKEGWCKEPVMRIIDAIMPTSDDRFIMLFVLSCFWLMAFTYVMVDGSERVGCIAGIKQVIMGLIVLAAGTSVPDMISSIVVAKAGKGDMAVANAVGSNTFDLLLGLGAPWLLRTILNGPVEVPTEKLGETIIILSVCLVGYVAIVISGGWTLSRNAGIVMLLTYASVISYVVVKELREYTN